jgi:hypothetical protein
VGSAGAGHGETAVSIGGGAVASPTEQADIERATAIHSAIAPQLRFPHMRQR